MNFYSRPLELVLSGRSRKNPGSGCLEWIGAIDSHGYGVLRFRKLLIAAHRASWIVNKGEIFKGMWVLHKCDNRRCINPNHLYLGTHADNTIDMMLKSRSSGPHGSRLSFEQRREIIGSCLANKELADAYGVSANTIANIRYRAKHNKNCRAAFSA